MQWYLETYGDENTWLVGGEIAVGTNRCCPPNLPIMRSEKKRYGATHFGIGHGADRGVANSVLRLEGIVDRVTIVADDTVVCEDGQDHGLIRPRFRREPGGCGPLLGCRGAPLPGGLRSGCPPEPALLLRNHTPPELGAGGALALRGAARKLTSIRGGKRHGHRPEGHPRPRHRGHPLPG